MNSAFISILTKQADGGTIMLVNNYSKYNIKFNVLLQFAINNKMINTA